MHGSWSLFIGREKKNFLLPQERQSGSSARRQDLCSQTGPLFVNGNFCSQTGPLFINWELFCSQTRTSTRRKDLYSQTGPLLVDGTSARRREPLLVDCIFVEVEISQPEVSVYQEGVNILPQFSEHSYRLYLKQLLSIFRYLFRPASKSFHTILHFLSDVASDLVPKHFSGCFQISHRSTFFFCQIL